MSDFTGLRDCFPPELVSLLSFYLRFEVSRSMESRGVIFFPLLISTAFDVVFAARK